MLMAGMSDDERSDTWGAVADALALSCAYLGTLPLCGVVALLWLEGREVRRRIREARRGRQGLEPEVLADLEQRRRDLVRELDRARVAYLAGRLAATRLGVPDERLAVGRTFILDGREWTISGRFEAPGTVMVMPPVASVIPKPLMSSTP